MVSSVRPVLEKAIATLESLSRAALVRPTCTSLHACALSERSEEHTSELQSQSNLVCRLLLEKKKLSPPSVPAATVRGGPRPLQLRRPCPPLLLPQPAVWRALPAAASDSPAGLLPCTATEPAC